jgi:hypothetical protein
MLLQMIVDRYGSISYDQGHHIVKGIGKACLQTKCNVVLTTPGDCRNLQVLSRQGKLFI